MEPMILYRSGFFWIEKIKTAGRFLKNLLILPLKPIARTFSQVRTGLLERFHHFYYEVFPRIDFVKKKFRKKIYLFIIFTGFGLLIFWITSMFLKNEVLEIILKNMFLTVCVIAGTLILSYLVFIAFLYLYQYYAGEETIQEQARAASQEYVSEFLPKIAKIYGKTGKGKDETMAGLSTFLVEGFKKKIRTRMEEIQEICSTMFDFDTLDQMILEHADLFYSSSEKITKSNFFDFASRNHFFIRKNYQNRISIHDFIESARMHRENIILKSDYLVDAGGTNKKHYIELLYEYTMLRIRLLEGHFIFSNQPMFEDLESGTGAAIFSIYYLISKNQKPVRKMEENDHGQKEQKEYVEKVMFPFKNFIGICETEAGVHYLNLDRRVNRILQDFGIRDTKAFNRHFFPDFFWYQTDQAPERTSKLFRELDHAFIYPDSRRIIVGGKRMNRIYLKKIELLDEKIRKVQKKMEKRKIHIDVDKETRYLISSGKNKYYNLLLKFKHFFEDSSKNRLKILKLEEEKRKLLYLKNQNAYRHSYIEKILTISETTPQCNSGKTIYRPGDIINHPDIIINAYSVKLTFRLSDCWRYDTHYMKSLRNNRADQSELNLIDVPEWDPSMTLKKEDILTMGYYQEADLFGISSDEMNLIHFKKNQKKN